jgi:hypothetical protein
MKPEEFEGMLLTLLETDHPEEREDLKDFLLYEVGRLHSLLHTVGLPEWVINAEEPPDDEHEIVVIGPPEDHQNERP